MKASPADEVMELERKYWEALKNRDSKTCAALSDKQCLVTGPQGITSYGPEQLMAMMSEAKYELRNYRIGKGAQVQMVGDDVAVVAYRVHEDLVVDGKPVSLDAADSSTWIKRDGQWRCAMHTEAIMGDPFGRDRSQAQAQQQPPSIPG